MSKGEPKGENLLKSLKKEIGRGGAAVSKDHLWAPGGAPRSVQKQARIPLDSEIREILKIKLFLNANLGFSSPGVLPKAPEWLPRGAWGSTLAPLRSSGSP